MLGLIIHHSRAIHSGRSRSSFKDEYKTNGCYKIICIFIALCQHGTRPVVRPSVRLSVHHKSKQPNVLPRKHDRRIVSTQRRIGSRMRSMILWHCRWPSVTPNHPKLTLFYTLRLDCASACQYQSAYHIWGAKLHPFQIYDGGPKFKNGSRDPDHPHLREVCHLRPYSIYRIYIRIHSESGFGFTGKSNGLDSWVLSELTSLLFVYVCILMSLPVSLANPCQNWIRETGFGFVKSNTALMLALDNSLPVYKMWRLNPPPPQKKSLNGSRDHSHNPLGWFVICRLGLAIVNLGAKFEVSISTRYESRKGDTKSKHKMRRFGVVRSH